MFLRYAVPAKTTLTTPSTISHVDTTGGSSSPPLLQFMVSTGRDFDVAEGRHLFMNEWSGCCPPPGDAAASREPPAGDEALAELLLKLSVEMDIPSLRCAVSFQ
jgi:hypothetical protein